MSNCGSKRKMAYGGKVRKMAQGGKMKPVDKQKNPGLAKLPTEVRNKMGYMRNGGEVEKPKQKYKDLLQRGKPKPPQKPKLPKMSDKPKAKPMKKGGMAKKKAPKGMHYMPDGTLMKDSAHKKKSKKMMYGGTVKKMKSGGSTGNFGDAFQPKTPKERKAAAIDKVKRENKSQSNQERKKESQRKLKAVHSRVSKNMMKSGGTVKKMKHGGMAKCKRDGIAMRGRTRAGK